MGLLSWCRCARCGPHDVHQSQGRNTIKSKRRRALLQQSQNQAGRRQERQQLRYQPKCLLRQPWAAAARTKHTLTPHRCRLRSSDALAQHLASICVLYMTRLNCPCMLLQVAATLEELGLVNEEPQKKRKKQKQPSSGGVLGATATAGFSRNFCTCTAAQQRYFTADCATYHRMKRG